MKFKGSYIFIILLVIGIVVYNQFTKNKIVEGHGGGGGGRREFGGYGFGLGRGFRFGTAALDGYGLHRGYGGYYGDGYDYTDSYYSYPYEQILYDANGNPIVTNQLTPLFV